ncbi:MAG: phosphoribosyltransferase [Archaeoglobaceae archaeon]
MSFKCIVTNWDYMDSLCGKIVESIREDGFEPQVIVALAKGGWFAGRILSDLLGQENLISMGIKHYSGITEKEVKIEALDHTLEGKNVLIIDDIANTGESVKRAYEQVKGLNGMAKTAVLQLMYTSSFTPDYFGEYITEDAWMIFPWNFFEDMTDIIKKLMEKKEGNWNEWDIKQALYSYHGIDPIYLEIVRPRKLFAVMREMEWRGIVKGDFYDEEMSWRLNDE